ncbi:ABC transporter permease subunit [Pseudorhizobium flavum]|uniref:ABC transporter permease subunit n=1 Tax=Pseudorhizobium flavum TaxID=1335061 RepID=UPI00376FB41D
MSSQTKTLAISAVVLVLLPVVLPMIGLTLTTATMVVSLCIAVLGLNLLMGYTGLVSFGHAAWFGMGGYAAALLQPCCCPPESNTLKNASNTTQERDNERNASTEELRHQAGAGADAGGRGKRCALPHPPHLLRRPQLRRPCHRDGP